VRIEIHGDHKNTSIALLMLALLRDISKTKKQTAEERKQTQLLETQEEKLELLEKRVALLEAKLQKRKLLRPKNLVMVILAVGMGLMISAIPPLKQFWSDWLGFIPGFDELSLYFISASVLGIFEGLWKTLKLIKKRFAENLEERLNNHSG
jgi:hypothetical protein